MATGTLAERDPNGGACAEQLDAWSFYGLPSSFGTSSEVKSGRQVGEVRYVVGWAADQMSRMGWRILVGGSETWTLTLPGVGQGESTVVRSNGEQDDPDAPDHPVNASAELLEAVGWNSSMVRQVTTNLYVAGEMQYILTTGDAAKATGTWQVVSVIHPHRDKLLKESKYTVRGLIPHPADPDSPDAPIFGVLPILEDMDWLNRLSRSQSSNRVGTRGLIGIADDISIANGAGEFFEDFEDAISKEMTDPTDVAPVILRGPAERIAQRGNGMEGLSWVIPTFPYDDKVDARMAKLVERLAYGLPIPPEILLGMQAASRATAFQVEEQSYRAHIEPMAVQIAKVPREALELLLSETEELEIVPDPTTILARRHSTQDVLEAFDRGAVGYDYLRETLGIPNRAEPSEEDDIRRAKLEGSSDASVPTDPGAEAAEEAVEGPEGPVNAAAGLVSGPLRRTLGEEADPASITTLDELSEALDHVDATLLAELGGATQQATERAREVLGAAVRSSEAGRSSIPADIPNVEVATKLGADGLAALGVNLPQRVEGAVAPLLGWWETRVTGAQKTVAKLLGEGLAPTFSTTATADSLERLELAMAVHVEQTLGSPVAQPLSAAVRMEILSLAGEAV